ncbi:uncharacterized protein LOC135483216 isoform X2 [Lineus longissimus]|uniref:uncharacterized protein LOC135483216 isoform X2 n=1 Tax=Lineus longissimus TaxID=88925 RepID=UPI002B4C4786
MQKNKKALNNPPLKKEVPDRSDQRPYATIWMDSCYQETLLPDLSWTKVEPRVCEMLARKIQKQQSQPERMQMIFELVGPEFKKEYFPSEPYQPSLLETPHMNAEQKERLRSEAQVWLNSQAYRAAKESGCGRVLPGTEPTDDLCDEQMRFLQNVFDIFVKGLDRHLYKNEQEVMKKKKIQEEEEKKKKKVTEDKSRVQVLAVRRASMLSAMSSAYSRKSTPFYDKVTRIGGDEPGYYSDQTEAVGDCVKSILQRDPRRFVDVSRRLHGRQMPGSLRSYMWLDVLFKNDRERLKEGNVEKIVRERFGRAVARGVGDLKMKRATHSPIAGLIENAVVESYAKTLSMQPYNFEKHLVDTARALNILYSYDRTYEPYLIHWLFPMQVAFKEQSHAGEHVYELAMYLDLLNQNCFPSWPKIFAMAEQTLDILEQFDPEFHRHLRTIAQTDANINSKEFMVYLIHQEKEKAQEILNAKQEVAPDTPRSKESLALSRPLLADPLVFLRKWIGEGFVSVLDTPAVMFLWDQNFMQLWQGHAMENMCLSLLMLLRHKFMEANNYATMKDVFLNGPCCLYTADIQRAWIHVEMGQNLNGVPYLNRQRPITPPPTPGLSPTPVPGATIVEGPLMAVGLKDINVKLVIPEKAWRNENWMRQFNPSRLKLMCKVYFGQYKLDMKITHQVPYLTEGDNTPRGSKIFSLDFTADKIEFHDLDASQYTLKADSYPYAILRVDYLQLHGDRKLSVSHTALGWAKIPLYSKERRQANQQQPAPNQAGPQTPGQTPGRTGNTPRQTSVQGPTPQQRQTLTSRQQPSAATAQRTPTQQGNLTSRPTPYGQSAQNSPAPGGHLEHMWVGSWGHWTYPLEAGDVPDSVLQVPSRPPTTTSGIINQGSEIACVIYDPQIPEVPPSPIVAPKTPVKTPASLPTPIPTPKTREPTPRVEEREPTPDDRAWVPHKAGAAKNDPEPMDLNSTFDIYVDMVRFIPDLASIIKVTGRVLRTGEIAKTPDILTFPEIPNDPRSPKFKYKLTINEMKKNMDPNAVILLRVYTVQNNDQDLVVIGSCLIGLCNNEGKIKTGGYQLRLHSGMPELPQGIAGLVPGDLDSKPNIPCASVLVRILPHATKHLPAPEYRTCYYHSDDAQPTQTEWGIFNSYLSDTQYPKDYLELVKTVKYADRDGSGTTHHIAISFLPQRLDNKKYLPPQKPANQLDLGIAVRYRQEKGMMISIQKAFGLDGVDVYTQCFVKEVRNAPPKKSATPDGDSLRFLTEKMEYDSPQKAPLWVDSAVTGNPVYRKNSFLYIQVYCMKFKYTPNASHSQPGKLTSVNGQQFDLAADSDWFWTAVPMYKWESTHSGIHTVPLFKGRISPELKAKFLENGVEETIFKNDWDQATVHPTAGLIVKLLDKQYEKEDEFPIQPLPQHKLIDALGNAAPYLAAMDDMSGKKIHDLVVDSLEPKYRKLGASGETYLVEQKFYSQLAVAAFKEQIN